MAAAYTGVDALGIYLSGAYSDGATQRNTMLSLGGYRSNCEARRASFFVKYGLAPIRIDWVSGSNPAGDGSLEAQGASALAWKGAGGTKGAAVTIANGETKLIESNTAAQAIRVTRVSTDALKNTMVLTVGAIENDLLGMDHVSSAEAVAGLNTYLAAFLYNHSPGTITSIKLWLKTLGTQRATGTAQLGASGAGTITTATANGFADWKQQGWAHIKTSGGTTREIVYYTSRTATSLTVPAAGRARLGTSAAAGSATDTIDNVPGIRIATESPTSNAIQTIVNDATAPTGVSWSTAITSATGLTIASLAALASYGLWIHREVPAGMAADADVQNAINVQFIYSAVTYDTVWDGRYAVANDSVKAWLLYEGIDTPPTFTTPTTTFTTLPSGRVLTPPGAGFCDYYHVLRYRNEYGLVSGNIYARRTRIDSAGFLAVNKPNAPNDVSLQDIGGGLLRLRARYDSLHDDPKATQWAIRTRGDGVDPTSADAPTYVDMTKFLGLFAPGNVTPLAYILGPYAPGQEVRVLLTARHAPSGAESVNATATTATVVSDSATVVRHGDILWGTTRGMRSTDPTISRTEYIDLAKNIYSQYEAGYVEFWAESFLIWRVRLDSGGSTRNGLWTTLGFKQTQISGTPSTTPVDTSEYSSLNKVIYITVNGVRRMKIDITNGTIECAALNQLLAPLSSGSREAIHDAGFATLFQVYDAYIAGYSTAMHLDDLGRLRMRVGWRQRETTGAFL